MRYYVLRFVTLVLLLTSASAWSQEFPCESAKLIVPWARGCRLSMSMDKAAPKG